MRGDMLVWWRMVYRVLKMGTEEEVMRVTRWPGID